MSDYFTESVLLIIDNDREALRACLEIARIDPLAIHKHFQDYIERRIESAPIYGRSDFASCLSVQLATAALGEVDWHAVADHYREKVAEGASVPSE